MDPLSDLLRTVGEKLFLRSEIEIDTKTPRERITEAFLLESEGQAMDEGETRGVRHVWYT